MKADFALTKGWWYPAVVASVLVLYILFMKKRNANWKELLLVFSIIGYIVWMVDFVIAGPFDLFDVGHPQKEGLPEILLFGVIPPCLSAIYVNYYNRENKWTLGALFVILSWGLEWGAIQVGLTKYKIWSLWYSPFVHIAAYAFFLPWLLRKVKYQR